MQFLSPFITHATFCARRQVISAPQGHKSEMREEGRRVESYEYNVSSTHPATTFEKCPEIFFKMRTSLFRKTAIGSWASSPQPTPRYPKCADEQTTLRRLRPSYINFRVKTFPHARVGCETPAQERIFMAKTA